MRAVDYFFPEAGAGGYTRFDGMVEFYGRVNALLRSDMTVLDFGAGRGSGPTDDPVPYRRALRTLKGKCARLIGVDVDEAIRDNPFLHEAFLVRPGEALPLADQSVDLIVSDAVFEHVEDPEFVAGELDRVLKPGGWICARTPNRWGYIGLGATLVPNRWHVSLLKRLQPGRQAIDVFPTAYKMNTKGKLRKLFPRSQFRDFTYGHFPEPAYFAQSRLLWGLMLLTFRLTPERLVPMWLVFLHKEVN